MMNKIKFGKINSIKRIQVIVVIGLVAILISFWFANILKEKIEHDENNYFHLKDHYNTQNHAFELLYDFPSDGSNDNINLNSADWYIPSIYFETEQKLKILQIKLNAFNYYNNSDIKIDDIREFLKNPFNEDGSPKTYADDNGLVNSYVRWYDFYQILEYRSELNTIIFNLNFNEFKDINDLSLSQINDLCSLYNGSVDDYPYDELKELWAKNETADKK